MGRKKLKIRLHGTFPLDLELEWGRERVEDEEWEDWDDDEDEDTTWDEDPEDEARDDEEDEEEPQPRRRLQEALGHAFGLALIHQLTRRR